MIDTNNFKGYFLGVPILFYICCTNAMRAPDMPQTNIDEQECLNIPKDNNQNDSMTLDPFAEFTSPLMHLISMKNINSESERLFVLWVLSVADNLIGDPHVHSFLLSLAMNHVAKPSTELIKKKDLNKCMEKFFELTMMYICLSVSYHLNIGQEEISKRMERIYERECNLEAVKGIDQEFHPLFNFFENGLVFTQNDSLSFIKAVFGRSADDGFFRLTCRLAMKKDEEYDITQRAFDFEKRKAKTLCGKDFRSFRESILTLLSEHCSENYRALAPEKKDEIDRRLSEKKDEETIKMLLLAMAENPTKEILPIQLQLSEEFDPLEALACLTTRAYHKVDRRLHQVELEISNIIGLER